jgi:hypothetical protein
MNINVTTTSWLFWICLQEHDHAGISETLLSALCTKLDIQLLAQIVT